MTIAERELATIGFGQNRGAAAVWRVVRLDPPLFAGDQPDPADSDALRRWRKLLARGRRRSPYRISRVAH